LTHDRLKIVLEGMATWFFNELDDNNILKVINFTARDGNKLQLLYELVFFCTEFTSI